MTTSPRRLDLYSSVTGAAFWSALLDALRGRGFDARDVGAIDAEADRHLGQLRRRWRMYAVFAAKARSHARRSDADFHIVTTNPFFAPLLIARQPKGSANAKTICLLYDLFPDALEIAGLIRPGGPASRFLATVTRKTFARCDAVVFLGEHLHDHAIARYGRPKSTAVIPVGADPSPFAAHPPREHAPDQPIDILYCGQMGRMHDADTVAQCIGRDKTPPGLRWRFHGRGAGIEALRPLADMPQAPITLGDPLPHTAWCDAMRHAPVGLITLRDAAEQVCMPSKTYSALAAGQAVLAICPDRSDLARLVRQYDVGWVVPPGDGDALEQTLQEITHNPQRLIAKRTRAFEAGQDSFAMPAIAEQWEELLVRIEV